MNTPETTPDWLEAVQSRRISEAELAVLRQRLSGNPLEAAALESELALNAALSARPLPRVSNHFASQVWAEIDRPVVPAPWFGRRWLLALRNWGLPVRATPAFAMAMVLVATGLGWSQVTRHQRSILAANLSEISRSAPDVEVLRDFESIRAMAVRPQPGDLALIAALESPPPVR